MANTPQNNTHRYRPDSIFKWIMNHRFNRLGIPIQTQVEVGYQPRSIDVVFVLESETDLEKVRNETELYHADRHNLIEFKSENDPLTIFDLQLIVARANLYKNQNRILSRRCDSHDCLCQHTAKSVTRLSRGYRV